MGHKSLTSLLARWEEALGQGRELTPEELCADTPSLLGAVRDGIALRMQVRVAASGEPSTVGLPAVELDPFATGPQLRDGLDSNATVPPLVDETPRNNAAGLDSPPGYEILGELGRGGMGVVYKARQEKLNRVVALKMILAGGHAGSDDRLRFLAEAEAIARIRHPGIVQVHDFGTHEGKPFFTLEFCEGGSLADKLKGTPLPPKQAAEVVEPIARAVHAAHAAGIVHRDLKPGNVLLGTDGAPRVTDFGLAKRVEGGGNTQTGAVMGTPSYMAPEQAQGAKDVGPLADVYAVGAILYECLSGRPPFRAATTFDTLLQVVADEPVALRELNAKVPPDLETICHRCLQKDPAKRYASAETLADDLRRYLDGRPIAARPVGRVERLVRWGNREPVVAGLLGAVIGVLALGAAISTGFAYRAERNATAAENNAEEAREQERQAKDQKARADENASTAKQNEAAALEQKRQADEQRDRAERLVYAGKLSLAQSAWQENNVIAAFDLLNECQWNLRGWEHRHLWTLYNCHLVTLKGHTNRVSSVAYSPDGKRIVSGSEDNTVKVWDAEKGTDVLTLRGHTSTVSSVAFSRDGKRIVSGSWDRTLKVWDAEKGTDVLTLKGHTNWVSSVAFSPDGTRIVSGGLDNTVRVWDAEKGTDVLTLRGHTSTVSSVAYSPDGKRIVSGSWDNTVKVWDAEKGTDVLTLKGHTREVYSVAFSPDGMRIVSGSSGNTVNSDNTVKVWDAEKGTDVLTLRGHTNRVSSVAFSRDGKRIVSGSVDNTVKVWDAEKGTHVLTIKEHTGFVSSVAYSRDGKRIVSGSGDNTVKVWDAEKGTDVLTLKGHTNRVTSVAFSPDGTRIVSEDHTGKRLAWDVITGQPVPVGELASPKGQFEARHAGRNMLVRIEGMDVVVQPLDYKPPDYSNDPILNPNLNDWHNRQAAEAEQQKQPFAAAFHLERLYRLQPTAAVRARLHAALSQAPDSPAGRTVRDRLTAFDAARLTALIAGRHVLPPHLPTPVPPLAAAPPSQPARMPRID